MKNKSVLKNILKSSRRALSVAVALFLVLGIFALTPVTASAATVGSQLDFTGMPTTSTPGDGWEWDSDTKTLTLNGFDMNTTFTAGNNVGAILLPAGSTIILQGTNSVTCTNYTSGVYCAGNLEIQGPGELSINSDKHGIDIDTGSFTLSSGTLKIDASEDGLFIDFMVAVTGGNLNIQAGEKGINVDNVNITGGTINISAGDFGLYVYEGAEYDQGNFTISGGYLTIIAQAYSGIYATYVTINEGTVDILSKGEGGIFARYGKVTINGGSIIIRAEGNGIESFMGTQEEGEGRVTINGGLIDILSGKYGVFASYDFVLTGGTGTIRSIGVGADNWAVIINSTDTITVANDIIVKGWDGTDYTIEASGGEFEDSELLTFLDAATMAIPMTGIRFGPEDDDEDDAGTGSSANGVPQTGDSSGFLPGAIVLIAIIGGLCAMVVLRRRFIDG